MSEETVETLTNQYAQICTQIGDAQYKVKNLVKFIESANAKLAELDAKAAEIKGAKAATVEQNG